MEILAKFTEFFEGSSEQKVVPMDDYPQIPRFVSKHPRRTFADFKPYSFHEFRVTVFFTLAPFLPPPSKYYYQVNFCPDYIWVFMHEVSPLLFEGL